MSTLVQQQFQLNGRAITAICRIIEVKRVRIFGSALGNKFTNQSKHEVGLKMVEWLPKILRMALVVHNQLRLPMHGTYESSPVPTALFTPASTDKRRSFLDTKVSSLCSVGDKKAE